jgi:hypothetical protein
MSLYCFGKVVPASARDELEACVLFGSGVRLVFSDLDPEDIATISEFGELKKVGVTFRAASDDGESSATALWLEASEVANRYTESERTSLSFDYSEAVKATAFGGFVWNLLNCPAFKDGALAMVDGPVETVFQTTAQECWNHFLRIIPKTWDCHDNPLFIWSAQV